MIDKRFYNLCPPTPLGQLLSGLDVGDLSPGFLDQEISGVADLASSIPGTISFLISKKHKDSLVNAHATACLAPDSCAALVGESDIIPVVSSAPRTHFGRVVDRMISQKSIFDAGDAPQISKSAKVHSTAVISAGAIIGDGAEIHPYVVIGPGVVIGAGTVIHAHASIECAVIGGNCIIKANASIGTRGFGVDADENGIFDLPHVGRVMVGDRVSVGSQTAIDRGLLGDTVIGNDVKIDNLVQIAHNVEIGENTAIAGCVGIAGSAKIGKRCKIAGRAAILGHLEIVDDVTILVNSMVTKSILESGEYGSMIPVQRIQQWKKNVAVMHQLDKLARKVSDFGKK